jgi:ubiquinone/menaquinone biosynthesis C-methylase UbiE
MHLEGKLPKNSAAIKQYKNLAHIYDSRFQKFISVTTNKVATLANIAPGGKVLDLGCGTGGMLFKLGQEYPNVELLAGIDASEDMLQLARIKLNSYKNVDLQLGSVEKLPYPDENFDLIVSSGVIHYVQDTARMIEETLRVLKPHGNILLTDMAKESMATKIVSLFQRVTDPGAVRYYSLHSASELLQSRGFEIQSAELFKAGSFGLYLIQGVKP